ncbi:hypothetical protein AVEN_159356-1 [Araneus ventricosus]|uniref:DUF4817 domain-containing protein n=1 Tax=Araneus ventricosus TaxID=182803 RepID=A0A4Y2A0N8_ARAVE|nr:hypothetical protein AVEN_159356-1 [Araneus ventricosus]
MERHTCSSEITTMKRMFLLGCTLMLRVMAKCGINQYCEMLFIYGECGRKAKSAARLCRERFPESLHSTRQTILKVVKRLRDPGCVKSRPRNVGRKVQPEDVLVSSEQHKIYQ